MKQMVLFQTILNVKKSLKNNDLSLKMFAFFGFVQAHCRLNYHCVFNDFEIVLCIILKITSASTFKNTIY